MSTMERMQQMEAEMNLLRRDNPQSAADSKRLEHAITTAVTTAMTSKENMTTDHRPPKLPEQPELMALDR